MKNLILVGLMVLATSVFGAGKTGKVMVGEVKGMHCGGCEQEVKDALAGVPEIKNCKVDFPTKKVTLELKDGSTMTKEKLNEVLKKTQFSVTSLDEKKH